MCHASRLCYGPKILHRLYYMMDEKTGRDLFISETRRNAMMDYTTLCQYKCYPTYNTQAAVGKPAPRMAPSKWTWPRVLQAGYNDQIYNNSNNNNNNVFSRSGATHDRRAATTPVRCARRRGGRPFSMVIVDC